MAETHEPRALTRLESALRGAARRYVEDIRTAERDGKRFGELRACLSRLGYDGPVPGSVSGVAGLDAAARGMMRATLEREVARLSRLARAGRADYDCNRHIAVRRALATLLSPVHPEPPRPASGRELNERFARWRAGRTPASRSAPAFAPALLAGW